MTAVTETTFADELIVAARPRPIDENPFMVSVVRGEASGEQIRRYAAQLAGIAAGFPRVLSMVLAVCDEPRVRHHLIANLLEEEGVVSFDGRQLLFDPRRSHTRLGARFANAAGASGEVFPPPVSAWFQQRVAAGSWIGPYAYFAVGHEANVPPTFRLLLKALPRHYGFDDESLVFLSEHVTADERHGREAAEMIASIAATPAARAEALEGARRGGLSWWGLHKSLAG